MNLQQSQQHFSILKENFFQNCPAWSSLLVFLLYDPLHVLVTKSKMLTMALTEILNSFVFFFHTQLFWNKYIFLRQFINIPEKRLTFSESNGFFFQKKCLKERLLRDKTYTKYRIWSEKKAFRISNLFQGKEWLFFCYGPKQIIIVRLVLFCFISFA